MTETLGSRSGCDACGAFDEVEPFASSGGPFLNVNRPTGAAAVVSKVFANRYSAGVLRALGIGFITTVFATKPRQFPVRIDRGGPGPRAILTYQFSEEFP